MIDRRSYARNSISNCLSFCLSVCLVVCFLFACMCVCFVLARLVKITKNAQYEKDQDDVFKFSKVR